MELEPLPYNWGSRNASLIAADIFGPWHFSNTCIFTTFQKNAFIEVITLKIDKLILCIYITDTVFQNHLDEAHTKFPLCIYFCLIKSMYRTDGDHCKTKEKTKSFSFFPGIQIYLHTKENEYELACM